MKTLVIKDPEEYLTECFPDKKYDVYVDALFGVGLAREIGDRKSVV